MITAIFTILMIAVFGRLFIFALKATWTITKWILLLLLLPVGLIAFAIFGLFYLAIPILVIVGIVSILKNGSAREAAQS